MSSVGPEDVVGIISTDGILGGDGSESRPSDQLLLAQMACSGEKALITDPLRVLRMLTQITQYQNLKGTSKCYCQIYMD